MAHRTLPCGFIDGRYSIWLVLSYSPLTEGILGEFPIISLKRKRSFAAWALTASNAESEHRFQGRLDTQLPFKSPPLTFPAIVDHLKILTQQIPGSIHACLPAC